MHKGKGCTRQRNEPMKSRLLLITVIFDVTFVLHDHEFAAAFPLPLASPYSCRVEHTDATVAAGMSTSPPNLPPPVQNKAKGVGEMTPTTADVTDVPTMPWYLGSQR